MSAFNGQKNPALSRVQEFFDGAGEEIRTPDLRITNALLYQLSYTGLPFCFQRPTFASSAEESNYEEVFDA